MLTRSVLQIYLLNKAVRTMSFYIINLLLQFQLKDLLEGIEKVGEFCFSYALMFYRWFFLFYFFFYKWFLKLNNNHRTHLITNIINKTHIFFYFENSLRREIDISVTKNFRSISLLFLFNILSLNEHFTSNYNPNLIYILLTFNSLKYLKGVSINPIQDGSINTDKDCILIYIFKLF